MGFEVSRRLSETRCWCLLSVATRRRPGPSVVQLDPKSRQEARLHHRCVRRHPRSKLRPLHSIAYFVRLIGETNVVVVVKSKLCWHEAAVRHPSQNSMSSAHTAITTHPLVINTQTVTTSVGEHFPMASRQQSRVVSLPSDTCNVHEEIRYGIGPGSASKRKNVNVNI